ncbi:MAG: UDPglucose--hexose-1-phosphate uridylyltransferase [Parcubacteria group bacterium Gr01-1014_2]|nr:MAG: UDPglucose--hexose-1-phosphate uridylyltransferase [Parcubacteria group bacterium Gr01-1014_2]
MDKLLNEFRKDLVSGDWVLFSTGRTKRPNGKKEEESAAYKSKEGCPFEDPVKSGQEIVWGYPNEKDWRVMVIKNKYPAVKQGICGPGWKNGPFNIFDATGIHDVIIFKEHDFYFADFTKEQATEVIKVYKKRCQEIASSGGCIDYVMIFHNSGRRAGASIYHPHSQIISTPILPPDVSRSFYGSLKFYQEHKKRVYDLIIEWEKEQKKRIIYENDNFIAFCPFVSKLPYEVRIFSKESHAHFERMPDELDSDLADVLLISLKKIRKVLDDPPYNFFIHTAPVETFSGKIHEFYSWHIEILPKLSISAGFELGTGIDINVVDPDRAAEELRNANV